MATTDIKYTLNAQLADNTLTVDDKDDKILTLVSAGTADKQRLISEIMEINPGLERETVEAVINLEQRVLKKLLLTGYRVNTGLFSAVAQFTGTVENNVFDPARNSIRIAMTQGKELREAIEATTVNIVGEKGSAMYVAGGTDTATSLSGFTATAGRNFTLTGQRIKLAGDDPSVGITLTDAEGEVTHITDDMIALNQPSKLIFLIPAGLADGEYKLTVTTQYSSGQLLKTPRSVTKTLYIGQAPAGGGEPGGGDDEEEGGSPL